MKVANKYSWMNERVYQFLHGSVLVGNTAIHFPIDSKSSGISIYLLGYWSGLCSWSNSNLPLSSLQMNESQIMVILFGFVNSCGWPLIYFSICWTDYFPSGLPQILAASTGSWSLSLMAPSSSLSVCLSVCVREREGAGGRGEGAGREEGGERRRQEIEKLLQLFHITKLKEVSVCLFISSLLMYTFLDTEIIMFSLMILESGSSTEERM